MENCWLISGGVISPQTDQDDSFFGGVPTLPEQLSAPVCQLCGAEQTFFFQVSFPVGWIWEGLTLSVFACTSCADERYLIPEMLNVPLDGANTSSAFLVGYQRNFRFLLFETSTARLLHDYREKIVFERITLASTTRFDVFANKIGGEPAWFLDDESPATVDHQHPMFFVLQLIPDRQFPIFEDAPRQIELDLSGEAAESPLQSYQLFNGNAIYLFGTSTTERPLIYAVTQI